MHVGEGSYTGNNQYFAEESGGVVSLRIRVIRVFGKLIGKKLYYIREHNSKAEARSTCQSSAKPVSLIQGSNPNTKTSHRAV